MFEKILIANRGEIACRVIDTARKLGVATVAVYSDADAGARHAMLADEAVHIGASQPSESYLRADKIIQAALDKGAQAIHPGYGFLSENPGFVDAVEAAGLVFIGPSSDAIRKMGLKDAAKVLMEGAGVPVVPGYHGDNQDAAFLAQQAAQIGYPVLIKAVAGGGGKGMRRVDASDDFASALASAQGEAQTAFGNADVLIEKYILSPRHIEVQVFGDGSDAVHLFERDCSLQRRHQKVIEEAPAPGMTDALRATMGQAAVRAARAIGYSGAGTVEFIVDGVDGLRADGFWFMEMNTRLQVEHPVTEAITGVDLVEWQLRVASGEGLPCAQDELTISGHAFEARIYAEDVPKGFLPATGTLTHLKFPDHVRADTGVRAGDTISPFYDPMIAKITAHAGSRAAALQLLSSALSKTEVAGTVTNLAFLGALARHAGFAAGQVDTGLIDRDLAALTDEAGPTLGDIGAAALCALGLLKREGSGFTLWGGMNHFVTLTHAGEAIDVVVTSYGADRHVIRVGEDTIEATCLDGIWKMGEERGARVAKAGDVVTVFARSGLDFHVANPLEQASSAQVSSDVIDSPMPGLVKAVFARAGQSVTEGDRLAILEAMKMEHSLVASRAGVVAEVLCAQGDQVEAGAALVRLEEEV